MRVEVPRSEGLEPGMCLILLRAGIRCPEVIRCYFVRDLGGRQSEVGLSAAGLGQGLLLGCLRCLILFLWEHLVILFISAVSYI